MSPKAMLLPVAMFTNLNSEPDLQGIAWLVATFSKLLEPTSSLKKCPAYTYRSLYKGARSRKFRQITH